MSKRQSKKSETLEVRLEHEVKTALMHKANEEGRSTSDVVRSFIEAYLAEQPKEARSMLATLWKPAAGFGAAAIAILWAVIAPAPLHAKPNLKAVFEALDMDRDGALALDEFLQHESSPAMRKMHEGHKAGGHESMARWHGQDAKAVHSPPSAETVRAHFVRLDANSDGSVKLAEFEGLHDQLKRTHTAP